MVLGIVRTETAAVDIETQSDAIGQNTDKEKKKESGGQESPPSASNQT